MNYRGLVILLAIALQGLSTSVLAEEPSIQRLDVGDEWEEITNEVANREQPNWSFRVFRNPMNHDLLTVASSNVPHNRSYDDTMEFAPVGYPFWIPDNRQILVNRVKTERTELFKFPGTSVDTIEYVFVNEILEKGREATIMGRVFHWS